MTSETCGPLQSVLALEVGGVQAHVNALVDERLTVAIACHFGARQDEGADDLLAMDGACRLSEILGVLGNSPARNGSEQGRHSSRAP